METETKPKNITIKLTEMKVDGGAIPITWCLNPEWLQNNEIKDWYVLLSTCQPQKGGNMAEWRGCCKLSEMMAYVTFYRPGVNRIFAYLTTSESAVANWMERKNGKWENEVILFPQSWTPEEKLPTWDYKVLVANKDENCDDIQIDLPSECFAKEPSEIEKTWVNWLFRHKAVDQCEFRRRRIFAYTIQPLLFVLLMVFRIVVALGCLSCGCKGINWAVITKPLYFDNWDLVGGIDGSIFHFNKLPEPLSFLFVPMIPLGTIGGLLGYFVGHSIIKGLIGILFGAFILPAVTSLGLFLTFAFLYFKIGRRFLDFLDKIVESREEAKRRAWEEWNRQQQELMSCSSTKIIRGIGDLPRSKRTIKLRFNGVKAMVCRPFAK